MSAHAKEPIRVFIVDDSALVRQVLTQLLEKHTHIRVIGMAADPLYAIEKLRKAWPDVLILDLEMPRMDGLTFLRQVMAERATPTIICSSLTEPGTACVEQALKAGAAGVFTKAKLGLRKGLEALEDELVRSVEHAARQAPVRLPAGKPVEEKKLSPSRRAASKVRSESLHLAARRAVPWRWSTSSGACRKTAPAS